MPTLGALPSSAAIAAANIPAAHVLQLLQRASREVRDLDLGRSVDKVDVREMYPLKFATDYVQRNKPVVITGAIDGWPALRLWGERYLETHPAGEVVVTVDVTPNGRGDAITVVADPATGRQHRWFVTPHERRMTLREFFQLMRKSRAADESASIGDASREVPYMQHQNSNLSEELGLLLADLGSGLPWAEQVFGSPPEATNIWIGDGRSATSFHKDHYENLYAVIRGTKVFSLLPPCDAYRMYLTRCPAACYMPYRDVPSGAVYGEVSTRPGGVVAPHASSTAAIASGAAAAGMTAEAEASKVEGGASARLVAVLQDPGYEVLWSAVDTTLPDPNVRRAQPLFFGREGSQTSGSYEAEGDGGGASSSRTSTSTSPHVSTCSDYIANKDAVRGSRDGSGAPCDKDHDENSSDDDTSSSGGDNDPWVSAGGAPLVVKVGPGEVLYLPSLWYHQVEQYTAAEGPEKGRQGRSVAGPAATAAKRAGGAAAVDTITMEADIAAAHAARHGQGQQQEQQAEEEYVIAVNLWYDMKYDGRYSAFKLVEGLATVLGLADEPPNRESSEEGYT